MKPIGWIIPSLWTGQRVWVIAGGGSIISQLPLIECIKDPIIVVKHSVLLRPDAQVLFWGQRDWHRDNAWVVARHTGEYLVKRKVELEVPSWIKQVERLKAKETGIPGLSIEPDRLGGFCSGGSALNLAFLGGAREIALVGFDFNGKHWFPGHELPEANEEDQLRHVLAIELMVPGLKKAKVNVLNCSPTSKLSCFTKVSFADLL